MHESSLAACPRSLWALCLLGLWTCATPARADWGEAAPSAVPGTPAPTDTVTLRDGSIYSGQIVEKVPGDHETLKLATGEIKRFDWAEMARTPVPPQAPLPGGLPPIPSTIQGFEALLPGERVLVRLEADNPHAALQQLTGQQAVYEGEGTVGVVDFHRTVCKAPCGVEVQRSLAGQTLTYRVGGDGVAGSDWFTLPRSSGPLDLQVKTGSAAGRAWGQVLTWSGIALAVAGGTMLAVGLATQRAAIPPTPEQLAFGCTQCGVPGNDNAAFVDGGLGAILGGVVALAVGIPLWAVNRTSVTTGDGEQLAGSDGPGPASSALRGPPVAFAF